MGSWKWFLGSVPGWGDFVFEAPESTDIKSKETIRVRNIAFIRVTDRGPCLMKWTMDDPENPDDQEVYLDLSELRLKGVAFPKIIKAAEDFFHPKEIEAVPAMTKDEIKNMAKKRGLILEE